MIIVSNGYIRLQNHRYADKEYKAWFDLPGVVTRVSKKRFRTAAAAIEYGKRMAEKYNRMYAEKQGEGERGEGDECKA